MFQLSSSPAKTVSLAVKTTLPAHFASFFVNLSRLAESDQDVQNTVRRQYDEIARNHMGHRMLDCAKHTLDTARVPLGEVAWDEPVTTVPPSSFFKLLFRGSGSFSQPWTQRSNQSRHDYYPASPTSRTGVGMGSPGSRGGSRMGSPREAYNSDAYGWNSAYKTATDYIESGRGDGKHRGNEASRADENIARMMFQVLEERNVLMTKLQLHAQMMTTTAMCSDELEGESSPLYVAIFSDTGVTRRTLARQELAVMQTLSALEKVVYRQPSDGNRGDAKVKNDIKIAQSPRQQHLLYLGIGLGTTIELGAPTVSMTTLSHNSKPPVINCEVNVGYRVQKISQRLPEYYLLWLLLLCRYGKERDGDATGVVIGRFLLYLIGEMELILSEFRKEIINLCARTARSSSRRNSLSVSHRFVPTTLLRKLMPLLFSLSVYSPLLELILRKLYRLLQISDGIIEEASGLRASGVADNSASRADVSDAGTMKVLYRRGEALMAPLLFRLARSIGPYNLLLPCISHLLPEAQRLALSMAQKEEERAKAQVQAWETRKQREQQGDALLAHLSPTVDAPSGVNQGGFDHSYHRSFTGSGTVTVGAPPTSGRGASRQSTYSTKTYSNEELVGLCTRLYIPSIAALSLNGSDWLRGPPPAGSSMSSSSSSHSDSSVNIYALPSSCMVTVEDEIRALGSCSLYDSFETRIRRLILLQRRFLHIKEGVSTVKLGNSSDNSYLDK